MRQVTQITRSRTVSRMVFWLIICVYGIALWTLPPAAYQMGRCMMIVNHMIPECEPQVPQPQEPKWNGGGETVITGVTTMGTTMTISAGSGMVSGAVSYVVVGDDVADEDETDFESGTARVYKTQR